MEGMISSTIATEVAQVLAPVGEKFIFSAISFGAVVLFVLFVVAVRHDRTRRPTRCLEEER